MMRLNWMQKSGFCDRLRQARLDAGIPVNMAAAELGIHPPNICRYERGEMAPSIKRVYELAQLYGCSIDWLCGGVKE